MGKPVGGGRGSSDPNDGIESSSGAVLFRRCFKQVGWICDAVSARCFVFILLGASVFLSAMFLLPPFRETDSNSGHGFSASIQASFILQKPFSVVSSYALQLEYDIFEEIGVPDTKVSVIDLHPLTSKTTYVVFSIVPNPEDIIISPVVLSLLRSSLIELLLQQSNLSLTTSIFGHVSSFEVLKFPGGITVIPVQSASIWQMSQVLFNFTLNNSITQIRKNLDQLKDQLKFGLNLRSYENVYVQMTNHNGSSAAPPVIMQAAVLSDVGSRNLLPPRLKQLAQKITMPPKNLGLDHAIFGKVNEVRLSSYLNNSITFLNCPSPSPSKSYEYPFPSPSLSPPLAPVAPTPSPAPAPSPRRPVWPSRPRRKRRAPRARSWASPKIAPFPSPLPKLMAPPKMAAAPAELRLSPALSPQFDQEISKFGRVVDSSSPSGASFLLWTWVLGVLLGTVLTL